MRILITGATGFLGKKLASELLKTDHKLYLLVRDSKSCMKFDAGLNLDLLNFIYLDDLNWKQNIKYISPEIVIHLASFLTSSDNEAVIDNLINSNLTLGTHLLDALKETNLGYFINTGSFSEYYNNSIDANPAYLYSATKTAYRSILQYYQAIDSFKIVNIIPYTIYGSEDTQKKIIDYLIDSFSSDESKKLSPGNQKLDFIHIDDVVTFYLLLIQNITCINNLNTEFHLGTGIGTTPKQLIELLESILNKKANVEWGGVPYRKRDTLEAYATYNLASNFLGWKPKIDLKEGLKNYLSILKSK